MIYQIKNLQGDVIFEAEGGSLKAVVELAVKQGANLYGANLEGANLKGANLYGANLEGANLYGANLPHFKIIPEIGSFLAFKKLSGNVIVQVRIPEHAGRTNSLIGRKCRASEVEIVKIIEGNIPDGIKIRSTNYGEDVYAVGEIVKADKWNDDIRIECTHGIHFFMTLKEAQEWS